jgi:hypothetical protein
MTPTKKAWITSAIIALVAAVTTLLILKSGQPTQPPVTQHEPTISSSSNAPQREFPQQSWKFAGYADPESAYQSLMWAMSQGNVQATLDSLTPAERAKWEKNMSRPKDEKDEKMARRTKQTERFRILDKQVISENETHMRIESVGESNENPVLEQWARMIKVGSDWKFEGWVGN